MQRSRPCLWTCLVFQRAVLRCHVMCGATASRAALQRDVPSCELRRRRAKRPEHFRAEFTHGHCRRPDRAGLGGAIRCAEYREYSTAKEHAP
jgi:hypothetical protein